MVTYQEVDAPGAEPYPRSVPGWKCRACDMQYGTAGLPPLRCKCGATWNGREPGIEKCDECGASWDTSVGVLTHPLRHPRSCSHSTYGQPATYADGSSDPATPKSRP